MENFSDNDAFEPSNLEEYEALLEDKAKASLRLVDALLKKSARGDQRASVNEVDGKPVDRSSTSPLILSL